MFDFLSQSPKLDGTNWETWRTNTIAVLMYDDAWGIANGQEPSPLPILIQARPEILATPTSAAIPAVPACNANQAAIDDWNKRNRQGLSLVVLLCTEAIRRQHLDLTKSLRDNWELLEKVYGTKWTLWADFQKFTRSELSLSSPLSEQLDELTNICTRLNAGGIVISPTFLALIMVLALPSSLEVAKQAILTSVANLSDLTPSDVRQRILSEEL